MTYSIEDKILRKIYAKGRGWVFSGKDFVLIANRSAIDVSLHRLVQKGTIRRAVRGIYDYPKYSDLLQKRLSPDMDGIAQAIARKFAWRIQPSGGVALNILGLSTQVPSKYLYLSDGPTRRFSIRNTSLNFQTTSLKEVGFKYHESQTIVVALKALGKDHINQSTIDTISEWVDPAMRQKILKDSKTVSTWIYDNIRKVCHSGT